MLPYPEIDPVAVSLGPLKVHWYGLTYLGGLAFAWWLALRRSARPQPSPQPQGQEAIQAYSFSDWRLELDTARLLNPQGSEVELTAGEFNLLTVLVEAAPRVLSRDHLLDVTVGREAMPFDRSIDIQISRLRSKLEPNPKAPTFIKTIRGQGYAFSQAVSKPPKGS